VPGKAGETQWLAPLTFPEKLTRRKPSCGASAELCPEIGRPSGGDRRSNVHRPNARRTGAANA
jgi:hypothetical protein